MKNKKKQYFPNLMGLIFHGTRKPEYQPSNFLHQKIIKYTCKYNHNKCFEFGIKEEVLSLFDGERKDIDIGKSCPLTNASLKSSFIMIAQNHSRSLDRWKWCQQLYGNTFQIARTFSISAIAHYHWKVLPYSRSHHFQGSGYR